MGEVDNAVKAARPHNCIVQHAWPVGGRNEDNALVVLKAVHLRQQLVDGLDRVWAHSGQVSAGMPSQKLPQQPPDSLRASAARPLTAAKLCSIRLKKQHAAADLLPWHTSDMQRHAQLPNP